ncbi:MAG: hypothetical protein JSW08_01720 [archaeon]|nr:MAG: hypothetical protein JSW08_01720 [archaeon]
MVLDQSLAYAIKQGAELVGRIQKEELDGESVPANHRLALCQDIVKYRREGHLQVLKVKGEGLDICRYIIDNITNRDETDSTEGGLSD